MENLLPNAQLLNSLGGVINWRVPKEGVVVSQVFAAMEGNKQRLRIDDWGICNTTLEEVFHSIVADDINDALEIEDVESDQEGEADEDKDGEKENGDESDTDEDQDEEKEKEQEHSSDSQD